MSKLLLCLSGREMETLFEIKEFYGLKSMTATMRYCLNTTGRQLADKSHTERESQLAEFDSSTTKQQRDMASKEEMEWTGEIIFDDD